MITAREKGRHLELIVGGGEDALTFLVPPITSAEGASMLADWVEVAFGATPTAEAAETKVRSVAERALSLPVFQQTEELRWGEQEQVINAAFMWNVQGGGLDLVTEYLSGGMGKARETLLRAVGLWEAYSLLQTSLASELGHLTSMAASPVTSTPTGGSTPSEDTPETE